MAKGKKVKKIPQHRKPPKPRSIKNPNSAESDSESSNSNKPTEEAPNTPEFSKEEVKAAIGQWLSENPEAPELVKRALESYLSLLDALAAKSAALRRLASELQKAFGIKPKSEKSKNYGVKPQRKSRRQSLLEQIDDSSRKARLHERRGRKQRKKVNDLTQKLKELDDIELSAEELAEIEANDRKLQESLEAGGDRIDEVCAKPSEEILQGLVSCHEREDVECLLDEASKGGSKKIFMDERTRLDVEISVKHLVVHVEKAEVIGADGSPTIISASTREYGPPRMNVTWNFLSQMSIVVGQYAMPMRRFASMLSTPDERVTPARVQSYFMYVASRLAPVYIHNLKSLANADILGGDDTTTRTLEITRALRAGSKPWSDYASRQAALVFLKNNPDDSEDFLPAIIGQHFDFISPAKTTGKAKQQFNTTVLHGRTRPDEPESTLVIFRSHFGSFGDLVYQILNYRDPDRKQLTTVSDLLGSNTVSHPDFEIIQAGCSSHARRRFKQAEDDYPDWAGVFLSEFGVIYAHEEVLSLKGRNTDNTTAVRQNCSRPAWQRMWDDAANVTQSYSASTKIGEAARYLLNHRTELTRYLDDPRLPQTNDLSERFLRPEKQIQASALFRDTIKGRCALDIVRSMIQTAVASGCNATKYFDWFLRQDPEEIKARPGEFTSLAFVRGLDREVGP